MAPDSWAFRKAEFISPHWSSSPVKYRTYSAICLCLMPMLNSLWAIIKPVPLLVFATLLKKSIRQMNLKCNKHDISILTEKWISWELMGAEVHHFLTFSTHLQFQCAFGVNRLVPQSGTCLRLTSCFVVAILVMITDAELCVVNRPTSLVEVREKGFLPSTRYCSVFGPFSKQTWCGETLSL